MDLLGDLALAILFALALYLALWAVSFLIQDLAGAPPGDLRTRGAALARVAAPGPTAVALGAAIAAFGALGWAALVEDADLPAFVINREGTVPTYFASGLLLAGGGLSLLRGADDRPGRNWWLIWGAVLIGLGLDEGAELHERLEVRLGVPAPVVLAPVGILAAAAYLRTLSMIPARSLPRRLYLAGAAAWATALLSDVVHGVDWKSVMEEVLEMSGSAMILIALLLLVREQ